MKKLKLNNTFPALALILLSTLLLGACATQSTRAPQATEAAPEEPAWAIEPWDGYGLEIPLDGSSMDAWERSLYNVKAYSDPADYELLLSAIDYLLVYDLGAKGKKELLIKRLNGQTGYQILSRVKYRKPAPVKGPAEKGSRDASPIDSG